MSRRSSYAGLGLFLVVFTTVALHTATTTRITPDFLTFRYAVAAEANGDDPYDPAALAAARERETGHTSVPPYFYPPAFLLGMEWTRLLPERPSYLLFVAVQPLLLALTGIVMRRWLKTPIPLLVGVGLTLLPLQRSTESGQVNTLLLALITLLGASRSGTALALATLTKVSPVLLVTWLLGIRAWRSLATFAAVLVTAVLLSAWLVPAADWGRYLGTTLPALLSGDFGDDALTIDLTLNHSIPNVLDRWWPSPDRHHLHPVAAALTSGFTLASAAFVAVRASRTDDFGRAALLGALVVVMTLTPAIVWDDHFVFLALPVTIAGTALARGRLPRRWAWILFPAYVAVALRPEWLLPVGWWFPELAAPALDLKTAGALVFGAACVLAAREPQ